MQEGDNGALTMKIKFVDCWEGAFTGSAVIENFEHEKATMEGTWYRNGDIVFVMTYEGVWEGAKFFTLILFLFLSNLCQIFSSYIRTNSIFYILFQCRLYSTFLNLDVFIVIY